MLCLTRRKSETIIIDNGTVKIVILDILPDKVRIGIEAPKAVTVHRGEVQAAIDRQGFDAKEKETVA